MSSETVFTKSVLKTKKKSKFKILFLVLGRIIKNNPKLFLLCSLLAIIVAIINFNIGVNFKDAFITEERTLTKKVIATLEEKKEEEIEVDEIKRILDKKYSRISDQQLKVKNSIEKELVGQKSLKKEAAINLVKEAGKDPKNKTIFSKKDFKFEINLFGWKFFERTDLHLFGFVLRILLLIFVFKSLFSLIHYYWMSYSYDSIERDLKKDLFRHFIRAKYPNSSEVSRSLITQFAGDLDDIAKNIWFIPNRLIMVATALFFYIIFDFNFGKEGTTNWKFVGILFALFVFLIVVEIFLFTKAAKLGIAAKKRYEEDNKVIYERINNLEYIKVVSGEKYEEKKIAKQLDSTFRKNQKSLWYSVLFKAVPNYVIIPNIPITFVALVAAFTDKSDETDPVFFLANFIRYYFTAQKLNSEINKIVDSLMTVDDLSSNLTVVNENAKILNQETAPARSATPKTVPFQNGDLVFQNVIFAYPKRPQQEILRNFSFRFVRGKIYGIAGKNGIGKSTITKTALKLYEIKGGQILIGENNIQNIATTSLHQQVCYQTNRPTFFRMSIAENVFYPNEYNRKDLDKLTVAAQKVGIYEFITNLPNGFDTVLKEGGTDLSEGQKQQIKAMQMFVHNYDIYILDEILSNVHPDLKKIVLTNIFARIKGSTILVIDHHYSIFHYVDYVYQFTGERLIEKKKSDFVSYLV